MKTLILLVVAAVAGERPIVVDNERVHLRDVVPGAPIAIAEVDVGAAPPPGERRSISEAAIRASLKRASVPADGLRIPKNVTVARRGQQLDVATLEALARRELAPMLGNGMSIDRLEVHRGVTLAEGDVVARIPTRTALRPGYQSVMLELRAGTGCADASQVPLAPYSAASPLVGRVCRGLSAPRNVTVSMTIVGDASALMPVIKRGDRVIVLAVKGGLTVQMYAVAQQDGRIGDSIPVIPVDGTKVVRAKVRDGSTVEVLL